MNISLITNTFRHISKLSRGLECWGVGVRVQRNHQDQARENRGWQKNVYDRICFCKVASLHCTNYKSTVKRLHHRLFSEYVSKTIWLKKNILLKKYMVYERFDKIGTLQCTGCYFTKNGVQFRSFWRSVENFDVSTKNFSWWKLLFSNVAGLESILVILLKSDSTTEISLREFYKIALFKVSEIF